MNKGNNIKTNHNARKNKKDEFYTSLSDIENELRHYRSHFKGKTVFCNCDDPRESMFTFYFAQNFSRLGLKKLISTHFKNNGVAYKLELTKDINQDGRINIDDLIPTKLKQNGDFRSDECVELLKEADIVVTNPPFSLFKEYIKQLTDYNKKFLIVGHQNAITYSSVHPHIKNNKVWLGIGFAGGAGYFKSPYNDTTGKSKDGLIRVPGLVWFTNLEHRKRNEELILIQKFNKDLHKKYDNYNAIECKFVKNIPNDYYDLIGVPITFLNKWNPNQFELIEFSPKGTDGRTFYCEGKKMYYRILIKRKK